MLPLGLYTILYLIVVASSCGRGTLISWSITHFYSVMGRKKYDSIFPPSLYNVDFPINIVTQTATERVSSLAMGYDPAPLGRGTGPPKTFIFGLIFIFFYWIPYFSINESSDIFSIFYHSIKAFSMIRSFCGQVFV